MYDASKTNKIFGSKNAWNQAQANTFSDFVTTQRSATVYLKKIRLPKQNDVFGLGLRNSSYTKYLLILSDVFFV